MNKTTIGTFLLFTIAALIGLLAHNPVIAVSAAFFAGAFFITGVGIESENETKKFEGYYKPGIEGVFTQEEEDKWKRKESSFKSKVSAEEKRMKKDVQLMQDGMSFDKLVNRQVSKKKEVK